MSTFVLIHGGWHASWCWDKTISHLERSGHNVKAPDLPGHGEDRTPIQDVSLDRYADHVCQVLDATPEPVILVGHSSGGAVISTVAERRPQETDALVYVAAFLLPNGQSVLDAAADDSESLLRPNIRMDEDRGVLTVEGDQLREIFYHDCPEEDVARAKKHIQPEPVAPLATPVQVTKRNFGSVRRAYITCTQDNATSPSIQESMRTNLPCDRVIRMNTGHFPLLAAPAELASHLSSIATAA